MTEPVVELEAVDYRRLFPWLDLFRAFGFAFELRKMALAALAVLTVAGGQVILAQLPFVPEAATPWPWAPDISDHPGGVLQEAVQFTRSPWQQFVKVVSNWKAVSLPLRLFLDPAASLFQQGAWSRLTYELACLAWGLCVWSVCAGALIRMSAMQYARDEQLSLWPALKFSGRRILAYLSAPALPLAGVVALWAVCVMFGWFARIPIVGEPLVGLGWFIPLICGFLMALILIGLVVGWPLMFAAISVEREDGFDALSRGYSYVYDRPWHYIWLAAVALSYGSLMIFVVDCGAQWIVDLSARSCGWGLGTERLQEWFPAARQWMAGFGSGPSTTPLHEVPATWAGRFVGGWIFLIRLLVAGFVHSYFWAAATIIYFLLRRSSDATDLDEVEIDVEDDTDDLLALVQASHPEPVVAGTVEPKPEASLGAHDLPAE